MKPETVYACVMTIQELRLLKMIESGEIDAKEYALISQEQIKEYDKIKHNTPGPNANGLPS